MQPLPKQYVMQAALGRLHALVEKYGITSPQVVEACRVWGTLLDEATS